MGLAEEDLDGFGRPCFLVFINLWQRLARHENHRWS